jgi:hypothetical protein
MGQIGPIRDGGERGLGEKQKAEIERTTDQVTDDEPSVAPELPGATK